MDAITTVTTPQDTQASTADAATTAAAAAPTASTAAAAASSGKFDISQFESFLKAKMGGNADSKVSEEALFSSLVQSRISSEKGADAEKSFSDALTKQESSMTKGDGFIPLEAATKAAIKDLRSAGTLSSDEADKIYSDCFAAAQLDSNTGALYDDRGGNGDTTIATADFATAQKDAEDVFSKIDAGTLTVDARKVDESEAGRTGASQIIAAADGSTTTGSGDVIKPSGTKFDGAGGFLFKPVSNNSSTLAVILPGSFKGNVSGVTLQDATGKVLDDGHSTGFGDDGKQEKFSFNKPGGDYPKDLTVSVQFMDGTTTQYSIPDPSQRYD